MKKSPEIIRMNIARYRAILSGPLAEPQRLSIERLLAEAIDQLARAMHSDAV